MNKFHLFSYGIGLLCGIVLVVVFLGVKALLFSRDDRTYMRGRHGDQTQFQQDRGLGDLGEQRQFQRPRDGSVMRQGGGNFGEELDPEMRNQRMAERFGMTDEELQAELDAGKTMQDIAEEQGLDFQSGFGSGGMRDGGYQEEAEEEIIEEQSSDDGSENEVELEVENTQ